LAAAVLLTQMGQTLFLTGRHLWEAVAEVDGQSLGNPSGLEAQVVAQAGSHM
jgi:hypothetical protein